MVDLVGLSAGLLVGQFHLDFDLVVQVLQNLFQVCQCLRPIRLVDHRPVCLVYRCPHLVDQVYRCCHRLIDLEFHLVDQFLVCRQCHQNRLLGFDLVGHRPVDLVYRCCHHLVSLACLDLARQYCHRLIDLEFHPVDQFLVCRQCHQNRLLEFVQVRHYQIGQCHYQVGLVLLEYRQIHLVYHQNYQNRLLGFDLVGHRSVALVCRPVGRYHYLVHLAYLDLVYRQVCQCLRLIHLALLDLEPHLVGYHLVDLGSIG